MQPYVALLLIFYIMPHKELVPYYLRTYIYKIVFIHIQLYQDMLSESNSCFNGCLSSSFLAVNNFTSLSAN